MPFICLLLGAEGGTVTFETSRSATLTFVSLGVVVWIAVVAVLTGLTTQRHGITLTPRGLVMHGLRERQFSWAEIESITVRRPLGQRMVYVKPAGRRGLVLRAPEGFFDRRFDEKVAVIRACWQGEYEWAGTSSTGRSAE